MVLEDCSQVVPIFCKVGQLLQSRHPVVVEELLVIDAHLMAREEVLQVCTRCLKCLVALRLRDHGTRHFNALTGAPRPP